MGVAVGRCGMGSGRMSRGDGVGVWKVWVRVCGRSGCGMGSGRMSRGDGVGDSYEGEWGGRYGAQAGYAEVWCAGGYKEGVEVGMGVGEA